MLPGRVRKSVWRPAELSGKLGEVFMRLPISREEIVGLLFAVYDLLDEVRAIRELLEGEDGEEEAVPE